MADDDFEKGEAADESTEGALWLKLLLSTLGLMKPIPWFVADLQEDPPVERLEDAAIGRR